MSKKNLFFILIIAFASFMPVSCKKGNITYTFDGKIVQSLSKEPLSGVSIKISQKIVLNGTTAEGHTTAGSSTTDASGDFEIVFDREKVTEFVLNFSKADYFPIELLVSSANVSTENNNTYNQELEPESRISFEITNSFPNDDDVFTLVTHNFREGCEGCAENTITSFTGSLDTTITFLTTPGVYTRFTYSDATGGAPHKDSIYTEPFQTIVYPILY